MNKKEKEREQETLSFPENATSYDELLDYVANHPITNTNFSEQSDVMFHYIGENKPLHALAIADGVGGARSKTSSLSQDDSGILIPDTMPGDDDKLYCSYSHPYNKALTIGLLSRDKTLKKHAQKKKRDWHYFRNQLLHVLNDNRLHALKIIAKAKQTGNLAVEPGNILRNSFDADLAQKYEELIEQKTVNRPPFSAIKPTQLAKEFKNKQNILNEKHINLDTYWKDNAVCVGEDDNEITLLQKNKSRNGLWEVDHTMGACHEYRDFNDAFVYFTILAMVEMGTVYNGGIDNLIVDKDKLVIKEDNEGNTDKKEQKFGIKEQEIPNINNSTPTLTHSPDKVVIHKDSIYILEDSGVKNLDKVHYIGQTIPKRQASKEHQSLSAAHAI